MYDFLLFVHVLSAFLLIAAMTSFWAITVATRPERPLVRAPAAQALARPAGILVGLGALGTLVFGVWLAIYVDGYELWDAWILGSIVLWAVSTAAGSRAGTFYTRAGEEEADARDLRRRGHFLQLTSSVAALVILILMIFKPGA